MGNIFQVPKEDERRQSEIPFDYFKENFTTTQFPRNRSFPHDNELYSVTHKLTQKLYTLKRMTFPSEELLHPFLSSLEHIIQLRHPNILSIEKYFVEKNYHNNMVVSYSVNIIMEHFSHTFKEELFVHQQSNIQYRESQIYQLLGQLVSALKFLQQKNACHGSICPSNIFVTADNQYKLCFVGEPILKLQTTINPNILLMMDYLAPKVRASIAAALISGDMSIKVSFDKHRSDVFSLGLVLLYMARLEDVEGLNITGGESERLYMVQGCNSRLMPKLLNIMELMLLENELERPNFVDLEGFIQIQRDEDSEWSNTYRQDRNSFLMQHSLPHDSSKNIEMKMIEDHSEQKKKYNPRYNSHYEGSIMSDYTAEENSTARLYQKSAFSLTPALPSPTSEEQYNPSYNSRANFAGSLSDMYMYSLKYSNGTQQSTTPEGPTPTEIKPSITVPFEELLIVDEEQLVKSVSSGLKRLVIKLKNQPQRKDFAELLAKCISKQKLLQELVVTLPSMSLGKKGVMTVIHSMLGLDHLRVLFLELRKDRVSVEALKDLGLILQDKKELEQLGIDLASNSLTSSMCKELVLAIQDLSQLKFLALNIGGNQIKSEDLIEISNMAGKLKMLENLVLYMYSNEVESADAVNELVRNIGNLKKLQSLTIDLSDNLIGDQGAGYVLNFIKESKVKQVCIEMLNNCVSEHMREKLSGEAKEVAHVTLQV